MPMHGGHSLKLHLEVERTEISHRQCSASASDLLVVDDNLVTSLSNAGAGFERSA